MASTDLLIICCPASEPVPVCGLSPAERMTLAARQAGIGQVVLLAEPGVRQVLERRLSAHPRLAALPRFLEPGEAGQLTGFEAEELLWAAADRVWLPRLLQEMRQPLAAGTCVAAAGDSRSASDPEGFSGLLRLRRNTLPGLLPALLQGGETLGAALTGLGEQVQWRPATGLFVPVQQPSQLPAAERLLLRSLVKPADGVVSRNINRRISLFLTRYLARTSLRPNHVTAVVLLLGLSAGPLAARGDYLGFLLGGLLYYLAAILDGCDGELSRLKYLGSPLGTWLDTITDDLSALSYLGGLYWGLARSGSELWLPWGAVAVAGNLLAVGLRYRIMLRAGSGDHQKLEPAPQPPTGGLGRAVLWVRQTIFRTDFLPFFAFVTSLAHAPWIFAFPYPAGAVAALVDSVRLSLAQRTVSRYQSPKASSPASSVPSNPA